MRLHVIQPLGLDQKPQPHCERSVDALCKSGIADITCEEHHSLYPADNRNRGVTQSRKTWQIIDKADCFLFVDWDMEFTPEHIQALIDRNQLVISAAYPYRGEHSDTYVAGGWYEIDGCPQVGIVGEGLSVQEEDITGVDWCGAGLLLVNADVFSQIPYPYFRNGGVVKVGKDESAEPKEDLGFCMLLLDYRIPVLVDCNVVVKHYIQKEGQHA